MKDPGCLHPSDDRLVDLALGLAHSDERDGALATVRACPECEARFQDVCRRVETVRLGPRPQVVEGRIAAVSPPEGPRSRARSRGAIVLALAAAAAVTIALLLLPGTERRAEGDGLDYWLPTDSERVLVRSGGPSGSHASFSEAIEAYARHDTRRVVELLTDEPMEEIDEKPMKLLLASALVWERRYAEAKQRIEELRVERIPVPYRDRARWILLTALERSGDREGAEKVLQDLAAGSGPLSERARRYLADR